MGACIHHAEVHSMTYIYARHTYTDIHNASTHAAIQIPIKHVHMHMLAVHCTIIIICRANADYRECFKRYHYTEKLHYMQVIPVIA